jgi:uncharacterized protein YbaR (Trm112 family)
VTDVDPRLLEILRCPSDDHAELEAVRAGDGPAGSGGTAAGGPVVALVCTFCATSYPVRDGIPVMLLDEATAGPHGIGVRA